jgi:L-fuculose-phosphate aldolase
MRGPGENCFVITPTSLPYAEMTPANIVVCDREGEQLIEVENAPSFELPLHVAVYEARPDVHAVIHTHSLYSTILSVLRLPLPPIVEEMAPYLGGEVRVAEYGQSGSDELARNAVAALGPRAAVLIANHGNLCVGKTLAKAFAAAELLERTALIYVEALKLQGLKFGTVHSLPAEVVALEQEMYEVLKES